MCNGQRRYVTKLVCDYRKAHPTTIQPPPQNPPTIKDPDPTVPVVPPNLALHAERVNILSRVLCYDQLEFIGNIKRKFTHLKDKDILDLWIYWAALNRKSPSFPISNPGISKAELAKRWRVEMFNKELNRVLDRTPQTIDEKELFESWLAKEQLNSAEREIAQAYSDYWERSGDPVPGFVFSDYFGIRSHKQNAQPSTIFWHSGFDLVMKPGGGRTGDTLLTSVWYGTVESATVLDNPNVSGGYGNHIIIRLDSSRHGANKWIVLAHLNKVHVENGDSIVPGRELGLVGNSGMGGNSNAYHLHIEAREGVNDRLYAVNPSRYLGPMYQAGTMTPDNFMNYWNNGIVPTYNSSDNYSLQIWRSQNHPLPKNDNRGKFDRYEDYDN